MSEPNPYQAPSAPLDHPSELEGDVKCPNCGDVHAKKVSFTWWGGALGPRLFQVVKCLHCGTSYNGKTGGKLTRVIIVYQLVALGLFGGIWLWLRSLQ